MIHVETLVRTFGEVTAVDGISFHVSPGEIFAFLGPNGAGKTTTIMNFLVMPIFFLSGALFPLNNLPTALTLATRADPLSYGVDGLRGALIGVAQFGAVTNAAVLVAFATGFLVLGAWAFSRIQI